MEPATISIASAGKALGLGRTKINELLSDGTLKSVKVGARRLIRVDSIHALVDRAA